MRPAVRVIISEVRTFPRMEDFADRVSFVAIFFEELREGSEIADCVPPVVVKVI